MRDDAEEEQRGLRFGDKIKVNDDLAKGLLPAILERCIQARKTGLGPAASTQHPLLFPAGIKGQEMIHPLHTDAAILLGRFNLYSRIRTDGWTSARLFYHPEQQTTGRPITHDHVDGEVL
jgi:hypothetical protein